MSCIKGNRTYKVKTPISNTLTVFSTLTLGDGCGRLQDSTASSSWWLDPPVLPKVNAIMSSFDAYLAQLRDLGKNRPIPHTSPHHKVVLHTVSKRNYNVTYLPAGTCRPLRQTYSIFLLLAGYTMKTSRPTHVISTYLIIVLSVVGPLLRTCWNNVSQKPSALPNTSS